MMGGFNPTKRKRRIVRCAFLRLKMFNIAYCDGLPLTKRTR